MCIVRWSSLSIEHDFEQAFPIHSAANLHKSSMIIVYIMFVFASDFLLCIHLFLLKLVSYLSFMDINIE